MTEQIDEATLIASIFLPKIMRDIDNYKNTGRKFVHYTTAENALKIIRNQEVWFRNTSVMNDYMEVRHGVFCLSRAYASPSGRRLKNILDQIHPNISTEIEQAFDAGIPSLSSNSYVFCVSEHREEDDQFGKLSMWRAYGANAGVAIVMNSDAFFQESDDTQAYTVKVDYADDKSFEIYLSDLADRMENNIAFIKSMDAVSLKETILTVFKFHVLCSKHLGFQEEHEWRVLYSPILGESKHMKMGAETIKGVPQIVARFPLKDNPSISLNGV